MCVVPPALLCLETHSRGFGRGKAWALSPETEASADISLRICPTRTWHYWCLEGLGLGLGAVTPASAQNKGREDSGNVPGPKRPSSPLKAVRG